KRHLFSTSVEFFEEISPQHNVIRMDAWQTVLEIVEKKVNQQSYNTWFKPTQLLKHDDKALYVRVPNSFFQDWLNDHIDVVIEAARLAGMGNINVIYITEKIPSEVATTLSQG